jgi:MFS family permease
MQVLYTAEPTRLGLVPKPPQRAIVPPAAIQRHSPLGTRDWRALLVGTAIIVAGVMPGFLTASLAPRIRTSFEFSDSTLGLAVAIFYVVCAIASTPAGRLVERIGATAAIRLGAALTTACCLAIAAFAQSAAGLIALLLAGGIGNAIGGPAVSALLRREVAGHRQGVAFGAQQSGASLGALFAGLALPAIAIPVGWRWAYVGVAALAVCSAALAPVVDRPVGAARSEETHGGGLTSVHALAVAAAFASAAGVGFISFLVTYSVDNGMSEGAAGLLLGGVSLAATVSRIGLGAIADRAGQKALRPIPAMLVLSMAGYLLLIVGEPWLIVLSALLAGGVGWAWPGALTLAVVQRSPSAPAWAVGVMMSGLFAGAVGGPLLVGLLAEHDVFAGAWIACATFAFLAAATIAAVGRAQERGEGI